MRTVVRLLVTAIFLGIGAMVGKAPAWAQPSKCSPLASLVAALAEQYDEALAFEMTIGRELPGRLYVSAATGTWTVIAIPRPNVGCVLATGDKFRGAEPPPKPPDQESALPVVRVHHAPSGWQYPGGCCSSADCFPLQTSEIERVSGGWLVVPTGEIIPFEDVQESSGDGHWHRCAVWPWKSETPTRKHSTNGRKCLYPPAAEF